MADRYSIALNKVPEVTVGTLFPNRLYDFNKKEGIKPGICLTLEFYYQNILLRSEEVTINFSAHSNILGFPLTKMDIMIDKIICKFRGTIIEKKEFPPMTITSDINLYYRSPSLKEFWDGFPILKNLEQT
jgi:hypothetical protein